MRKGYWSWCLGVLLSVLIAVTAYAWVGGCNVWGGNEYTGGNFGLGSEAYENSEWGEGATYVQTVVNGFVGYGNCTAGWMEYGWCADNAHADLGFWRSRSEQSINAVPYGWYTASSRHFLGGNFVVTRYSSRYFQEPPNCDNPTTSFDYNHCPGSPIVIATGPSRNYVFTSAADGVRFDLDNDGVAEKLAWTKPNSDIAFLAYDRNNNGTIDNGSELFGDHTVAGVGNGFTALRSVGGVNDDGMVDRDDPLFIFLLLWTDKNHNGISEAFELTPASDTLDAIGLGYLGAKRRDGNGNEYRYEGWARRSEVGKSGRELPSKTAWQSQQAREFRIYDVFLVHEN